MGTLSFHPGAKLIGGDISDVELARDGETDVGYVRAHHGAWKWWLSGSFGATQPTKEQARARLQEAYDLLGLPPVRECAR